MAFCGNKQPSAENRTGGVFTPEGSEPSKLMPYPTKPIHSSPAPLDKSQIPMVAVGGMGSKTNDNFFNYLNGNFSNVAQMPLDKPKGDVENELSKLVRSHTANTNGPLNVVGHSLGGTIAAKVQAENKGNPDPNINYTFADPPTKPPWQNAPFRGNFVPIAKLINQGIDTGLAGNPGTRDWSNGETVMKGSNPLHSPWNNPDFPGAQENMGNLIDFIRGWVPSRRP